MMAGRPSVKEEDRGGYKRLFAHRRRLAPPSSTGGRFLLSADRADRAHTLVEGGRMIIDLFPLAAEMLRTYGAGYRDEVI